MQNHTFASTEELEAAVEKVIGAAESIIYYSELAPTVAEYAEVTTLVGYEFYFENENRKEEVSELCDGAYDAEAESYWRQ